MSMFGISRDELAGISRTWRDEGIKVAGTAWTDFNVRGAGSDVLAAIRDSAGPARDATDSIGNRLTTLAQKVDWFAANVNAHDAPAGGEISELPDRNASGGTPELDGRQRSNVRLDGRHERR